MDIQEKLDAYFGGTLSPKEMKELEALVKDDPEFQKEFEIQKDISEAFRQIRFAELKSNLNSVEIPSGMVFSTWVKILSLAVVVSGLGIIGYLTFPTHDAAKETAENTVETRKNPEVSLPDESKPETAPEEKTPSEDKPQNKQPKADTKVTPPVPVRPNVIENFEDEENNDSINVPQNSALENSTFSNSSVEIEVKENTQYNFHYKFQNERLFLYGNFKEDLYNILEFKNDSVSQLFFYFKDKYYFLDKKQQEITPLEAITDPDLISNLDSLRQAN